MSWTYKLSADKHDLIIRGGKFSRVNGSNEVVQRIRISLWHHYREYFLNVEAGIPWYDQILGSKGGAASISNILRKKIMAVPGVIRIVSFQVRFDSAMRAYIPVVGVIVASGPGEPSHTEVIVNGIAVPI